MLWTLGPFLGLLINRASYRRFRNKVSYCSASSSSCPSPLSFVLLLPLPVLKFLFYFSILLFFFHFLDMMGFVSSVLSIISVSSSFGASLLPFLRPFLSPSALHFLFHLFSCHCFLSVPGQGEPRPSILVFCFLLCVLPSLHRSLLPAPLKPLLLLHSKHHFPSLTDPPRRLHLRYGQPGGGNDLLPRRLPLPQPTRREE